MLLRSLKSTAFASAVANGTTQWNDISQLMVLEVQKTELDSRKGLGTTRSSAKTSVFNSDATPISVISQNKTFLCEDQIIESALFLLAACSVWMLDFFKDTKLQTVSAGMEQLTFDFPKM